MRILELSSGAAATYAGLLLAELGYSVDRVDRAQGNTGTDPFLQRGKVDVEVPASLDGYDALVEDLGPAGLRELGWSYASLKRDYPGLVLVSLSPFGLSGPRRDWKATELTTQAAGGVLHCSGYDGEAPVKLPGETAAMIAGVHGATALLTALCGLAAGDEEAVHIDISAQDALMHHWTRHVSQYAYSGTLMPRGEREPRGIPARNVAMASDGWLFLLALRVPWQDIAAFLGLGDFIRFDPDDAQPWGEDMERAFHDAVASRSRYEWFEDAAELGWTFAPVEDPFQLMSNSQVRSRGAFSDHTIDGRKVPMPKLPFIWKD